MKILAIAPTERRAELSEKLLLLAGGDDGMGAFELLELCEVTRTRLRMDIIFVERVLVIRKNGEEE